MFMFIILDFPLKAAYIYLRCGWTFYSVTRIIIIYTVYIDNMIEYGQIVRKRR